MLPEHQGQNLQYASLVEIGNAVCDGREECGTCYGIVSYDMETLIEIGDGVVSEIVSGVFLVIENGIVFFF